jgi:4-azaleucine resistance transporter AzlC
MMGYTVLGFAFGLLITSMEHPWYIALLMSLIIYAGALQFLAVGFFSSKLGMFDIFISSFFVNVRQSFYGLSLLKKFKKSGILKPYLIFALTDETYALLTSVKEDPTLKKHYYYLYLSLLNQSYWVMGTLLGVLLGSHITLDTQGLEFSLTALFVVLAIEQYKQRKNYLPFLLGSLASLISFLIVPMDSMLLCAIFCALIGMFICKKALERG